MVPLCACGCGEAIIVKPHHKRRGIPEYSPGHYIRVNNPMTGKKHSEEARGKMSACHLGKRPRLGHKSSDETKRKLSEAGRRKWLNPEYRKHCLEMNKGRTHSEETKSKMSRAAIGRIPGPETRRKISESNMGKICSAEHREKVSKALRGRIFSEDHRKKISEAKKENFKDPEFCKKMGIAWGLRPNKPEKLLLKLLNRLYPNEWRYTGDFSFTINGKAPDFANINGQKKLIEFFGSYWHEGDDPQDRIDVFKPFGFDTLVIWENEMKNMDAVVERIHAFMEA
jgi:NUMOD3 motif-containing protein